MTVSAGLVAQSSNVDLKNAWLDRGQGPVHRVVKLTDERQRAEPLALNIGARQRISACGKRR